MKAWLTPIALLCAILTLSLLNCRTVETHVTRWQAQLHLAQTAAAAEDWPSARTALEESHSDWTRSQTYLHVVAEHGVVDSAEAMYRRAAAFAGTEEPSEFQAEVTGLLEQLRLLAEMERFSIKNIL